MGFIRGLGWVTLFVLGFVLTIGIALGYMWVIKPMFLDAERNAVEHSRQYIVSKNEELMRLVLAYNDDEASEGQKKATVQTFCVEVTSLSPDEWADPVTVFESQHC